MFRRDCGCLIITILSLIAGIIIGAIAFTTVIPEIVLVIAIALGIGIGALILLGILAIVARGETEKCICEYGDSLAIGAVGTIITAIIALSTVITAGVIAISVLIGFGAFFLFLTLLSLLKLLLCLVNLNCKCR